MQFASSILRAFLLSALFATFANSQSSAPPKSDERNFAGEPYVIELLRNNVRFEADGTGQREQILRVRVQSESAVREFGLLVYPFLASFETFDVVYARVRKPDGIVVDTPPGEIQELDSAVSREAPMYTDQREKHIAVKSLGVGDVLEVDLRWTIHDPIAPGHFWYDYNFFELGICLDEQLEFNLPLATPVKITLSNPAPQVKQDGIRRIYIYHSSNLKKAKEKDQEEVIPEWEKNFHGILPPTVRLSSFSSWEEVGAWYAGLQQPRVQVTPHIRSTAEEITRGKVTEGEKIRAVYDYVASRFRYIGIDLGVGRYTPHAAEDVLANRYGDCKDKHTLFAALLEAVGVHAYPVLISSKYKLDVNVPSTSLFDHVFTAIPQGNSYLFLDTTPEVSPFGLLVSPLRDRQALVIPTPSSAKLVTTPADPPSLNREQFLMEASIDSQGTLDGKGRFEERNDPEVILRTLYRNTPQNKWKDLTQALIARMGYGGTVSEVSAAQPEKTAEPFWFAYDYHRTDYSDWKEHRISLPFPPMFLPDLNEAQKKSKDPLPLGSPQEIIQEASLKLPEGILPLIPPSVDRKNDFAEYSSNYEFDHGVLHGKRHLTTKLREVPGDQRAAYTAFAKAIQDDAQHWIFLAGNFETASPIHRGQALLREGKTADAVKLLEKAAADDPEDPKIALALGTAYLRASDEAKAVAQYQKLLAGKPDAATLNEVAYEYANSNHRLNEALDYASRAVAEISAETVKATLDSATTDDYLRMASLAADWDTLGWAKFRSGDSASAEKYIEAAWTLWPRAIIGEHLVEVYEKLGKKLDASNACRSALQAPGLQDEPGTKEKLLATQQRLGIVKNSETGTVSAKDYRPPANSDMWFSAQRTFKLPRRFEIHDKSKLALFAIALENGNKTAQARLVSGDQELKAEMQALATADYRQPFPDNSSTRILRAGYLSCSKYSTECTLILFLVDDKQSLDLVKAKPD